MSRKPTYTKALEIEFLELAQSKLGTEASTSQITEFAEKRKYPIPYFIFRNKDRKLRRGLFSLSTKVADSPRPAATRKPAAKVEVEQVEEAVAMAASTVVHIQSKRAASVTESFIPDKLKTYVPFGFYNDLKAIIQSKEFFPIYITGMSGNGKTLMVQQACAALGRECVRVNITRRTDESDLIGSYELIDGNTIRREGPVILAMRRGAVLLLDETDYGTEDLLCLNGILEGNPYFDKKTGEVIHPAKGFNIIATANTKGKGSEDGRYIGANVLNDAFLERFAITEEQDFPPIKTERKILEKNFSEMGVTDEAFIENLINWADAIRRTFNDGAVDEVISTRRLVHIARSFSIFKNRKKAVEKCLARFDTETKATFLDLYLKFDVGEATVPAEEVTAHNDLDEPAF